MKLKKGFRTHKEILEIVKKIEKMERKNWREEFKADLIHIIRLRVTKAGEQGAVNFLTEYIEHLLSEQLDEVEERVIQDNDDCACHEYYCVGCNRNDLRSEQRKILKEMREKI